VAWIRGRSSLEGVLIDWAVRRPVELPRLPVDLLGREQKATELARVQAQQAKLAAYEAELILGLAADCPDTLDPPPDHPGARSRSWRGEAEFPGVSEFFVPELAMVLNAGRGAASFRARRAFCWRDRLPATFAALRGGELDERRAQELFAVLEHVDPGLARRVDAALIGEAAQLSVRRLGERARALLAELDSAAAEERRAQVQAGADVFLQPKGDGIATIGGDLPAAEAAEAYELIDRLAVLAKADGDERPIHQVRTEIFSLLLRCPGLLAGVRATLAITATLETLEGGSGTPAEVNGLVITPAQLRHLLTRLDAVGLREPEHGTLTVAVVDGTGRLLATTTPADLTRRVARGDGLDPPPPTDRYTPTDPQRLFVTTRDRTCRFPHCGQRAGWADHDHVLPHAHGGQTDCANLCCLCRSHHRLKTLARGWAFQMQPDGTLAVTTPSGVTRITRPPGLRRPPPPSPPPSPLPRPDPPPF
jgi:hypothetical protein